MKSVVRAIIASILSLAFLGQLAAQEASETIRTELLTVSINGDVKGLHYMSEGEVKEMEAFEVGMGSAIAYKGPRLLHLYDDPAHLGPIPEGEERPAPLAKVMLPKADRVMLIFSFSKRGDKIPRVQAVSVATSRVKAGDYQIFNNASQDCYLILDDKKLGLKPGQAKVVSKTSWQNDVLDLEVRLGVATPGGAPRTIYSSVWGHRPQRRMFLFLFDNPDPNRPVQIRKLYDVPSVKAIVADPDKEE